MSIRQRKDWISKKTGKGVWLCTYTDAQGSRRQKTFDRRKDADAFQAKVKCQITEGTHVPDSASITVAEAGALWLESCEQAELGKATLVNYKQLLRCHIEPIIGKNKLSQVSVPMVRTFEDQLRQEGRSAPMRRRVISALGSILADAQDRGNAAHNAVRERSRGKKKKKSKREQRPKLAIGTTIPSLKEVREILAAAGPADKPLLMTAFLTGLRASELRGLIWKHVDWDSRPPCIQVRQRADRFNEIDVPKSDAGERDVPIGAELIRVLKEWRLRCPRPIGEAQSDEQFVFASRDGRIETWGHIIGIFKRTQVQAGVVKNGKAKYPGLHCTRHFFASWCLNREQDGGLGLPLKNVQERLGHATLAMTADTYGHLFKSDDTEALDVAEKALLG